jgi:FMN-dependent NADH-azoreductase
MSTVLHLDASARHADSRSRRLSAETVDAWLARHPGDTVVYRDLAYEQLPLVTDQWVQAAFSPPDRHDAALRFALSRSDALIDELVGADLVVIGTPVYNFTVPAGLKAWIDLVARVGRTFTYTETGMPQGLLGGRRVVVLASSGSGPHLMAAMGMDHHEAYLRGMFLFLGIDDFEVVHQWGKHEEESAVTMAAARARIAELVDRGSPAQASPPDQRTPVMASTPNKGSPAMA